VTCLMTKTKHSVRPGWLLIIPIISVLSACGSNPVTPSQPPVIEDHSQPANSRQPASATTQKYAYAKTYAYPSSGDQAGHSAIADLRDKARIKADQGQLNQAAALLERALRIQPRDAWVWNQLADVRLRQQRYPQAESLARKSNSLAGQQYDLLARNWHLIATARRETGNSKGAEQALQHASEYSSN